MTGEFNDEMADAMVEEGLLEYVGTVDGERRYRLTELGQARAEAYIHGTIEGAELWARLQEQGK